MSVTFCTWTPIQYKPHGRRRSKLMLYSHNPMLLSRQTLLPVVLLLTCLICDYGILFIHIYRNVWMYINIGTKLIVFLCFECEGTFPFRKETDHLLDLSCYIWTYHRRSCVEFVVENWRQEKNRLITLFAIWAFFPFSFPALLFKNSKPKRTCKYYK